MSYFFSREQLSPKIDAFKSTEAADLNVCWIVASVILTGYFISEGFFAEMWLAYFVDRQIPFSCIVTLSCSTFPCQQQPMMWHEGREGNMQCEDVAKEAK